MGKFLHKIFVKATLRDNYHKCLKKYIYSNENNCKDQ